MRKDFAKQMEAILNQILPLVQAIGLKEDDAGPGFAKTSMYRESLIVNHFGAFHAGVAIAASFDLTRYTLAKQQAK